MCLLNVLDFSSFAGASMQHRARWYVAAKAAKGTSMSYRYVYRCRNQVVPVLAPAGGASEKFHSLNACLSPAWIPYSHSRYTGG